MFVAERWPAVWHGRSVRDHDEILAELHRQRDAGKLRNRDVMEWLNAPSSRVSEIFTGKRLIQQDEMPILSRKLWPDEAANGGARSEVEEAYAAGSRDMLDAALGLLPMTGLDPASRDAFEVVLPAIAEAARRAREDGLDARTAVATLSRHLWQQARPEGRTQ